LQAVQALTDLPLLAGGGVHTPEQAQALLAAGAAAVQLDSVVWSQPAQLPALLQALAL
jgi:NAD(P)H-dependent flavin oxidoreductase YrpB (nitropropane dioxygenase family)